jgi:predicted CXXCH cytochrome family protein
MKTDGCKACHLSHSSDENNLLIKANPALCLSCHSSGASSFKKAHGGYPVETNLLGCRNPHSSELPNLLKTSLHNPVSSIDCASCHEAPTARNPFGTIQSGDALCFQCHDATALKMGGDQLHVPFKSGMCLSCHNLMTPRTLLLTQAGNALCFTCHPRNDQW